MSILYLRSGKDSSIGGCSFSTKISAHAKGGGRPAKLLGHPQQRTTSFQPVCTLRMSGRDVKVSQSSSVLRLTNTARLNACGKS